MKNIASKSSMERVWMISETTQRLVLRWIHIILGIPIIGYVYSPFEQIPHYAPAVRFFFMPGILLSGLWMWKGHVLRRLVSKKPAPPRRQSNTGFNNAGALRNDRQKINAPTSLNRYAVRPAVPPITLRPRGF